MSMYAVKFWKHIGIPESYAIIDGKERKRYMAFFQSNESELKYWINGNLVQSSDLLQALINADKVNQKQVDLITRYAGPQNNFFLGLVPSDFRPSRKSGRSISKSSVKSSEGGFNKHQLVRLDLTELNEGDVMFNAFLLCKNPFEPGEPFEWVRSFKSTVHVDNCGNRYAYINDVSSRYAAYAFAESKSDYSRTKHPFRLELISQQKHQAVQQQTLVYKGADMGGV